MEILDDINIVEVEGPSSNKDAKVKVDNDDTTSTDVSIWRKTTRSGDSKGKSPNQLEELKSKSSLKVISSLKVSNDFPDEMEKQFVPLLILSAVI